MIGEICYWLFNMSIVASFMGLIVLVLRKIRLIPRRVSVFLWIVPFVRMCIPVGLNSPYSLMTLVARITTRTVPAGSLAEGVDLSFSNTIMAADSYYPISYKAEGLAKVFEVAGIVWLVGALSMIIALAIMYVGTIREIKDSKLLKENIYLSEKVTGPAVYGIIRPRIILPVSYAEGDLKYVLQHEKTHIRRLDNLWRILGFIAAAIHWFNPLSWVFLKLFLSDLELACDEMAVSKFDKEERKDYARTLLAYTQSKSVFVSAFGGAKVRTRIENVLSYKKITAVSAAGFAVLVLVIIYMLLTNAG